MNKDVKILKKALERYEEMLRDKNYEFMHKFAKDSINQIKKELEVIENGPNNN